MANYSVSQLTTIEDCDALLSIAEKEQKTLEWKKFSLSRQKDTYTSNAFENATELASRKAELEVLDSIIGGLPESSFKTEQVKKRTTVWYKVFLLENRQTSFGDVAVLEKEYELNRIQKELDETTDLMNEVEARKAEL